MQENRVLGAAAAGALRGLLYSAWSLASGGWSALKCSRAGDGAVLLLTAMRVRFSSGSDTRRQGKKDTKVVIVVVAGMLRQGGVLGWVAGV